MIEFLFYLALMAHRHEPVYHQWDDHKPVMTSYCPIPGTHDVPPRASACYVLTER